ncbi:MAG: hypothetical protein LBD88_05435, partial [Candidatus Peribacteria bacterium]|nr:hypothetical protein [Candidatus Peribacteria bacterium]
LCQFIISLLFVMAELNFKSGLSFKIYGVSAYEKDLIIPGITNNKLHKRVYKLLNIIVQR